MRFLGALWIFCLVAAGCEHRELPHSAAPAAVTAPQNQSTFELIERLEKATPWTPEQVMKTMSIELRDDPEKSGPAFKAFTQPASATSLYKSVELRMPNGVGSKEQLLIVNLAGDKAVSRKDIIAHFGKEFDTEVPSPQAKDQPAYLRYKRPDGYVSLGVAGDDARLVGFVISKSEK